MSKTRARERAKAKALRKKAPKDTAATPQQGRFDAGTGEIKGPHQSATQNFAGAKAGSARARLMP